MAEGTRVRELQEQHKQLEQMFKADSSKREAVESRLQDQITNISSEMEKHTGKFDNMTNILASIQLQLANIGKTPQNDDESLLGDPFGNSYGGSNHRDFYSGRSRMIFDGSKEHNHSPFPRVDFPKFDETCPRAWVLKCQGYFSIITNLDDSQKVTLATMNFEGKTAQWYQNSSLMQTEVSWDQFIDVVSARFEDLKDPKIISEFNKLKHTGLYADYVDKFEELKACMSMLGGIKFSEDYFISSFISGLSEEVQSAIHMFKPTTLSHAIELGHQQILNMEAMMKKFKGTGAGKPSNQFTSYKKNDSSPQSTLKANNTNSKPGFKMLTVVEMTARREKNLCFNCDEKFSVGHKCKQNSSNISYMIISIGDEALQFSDHTMEQPPDPNQDSHSDLEEIPISLNVITGEVGLTTMNVIGQTCDTSLHVLLDTGSSLSYIKESVAKELGCILEPVKPILVKIVDGTRMVSSHRVKEFQWTMQGETFTYAPRILNHEGSDLILGGDWLKACTPIELDYTKMTFTVTWLGKRVKVQALTTEGSCQFISVPCLYKMLHNSAFEIEEIYWVRAKPDYGSDHPALQSLLTTYADLFEE